MCVESIRKKIQCTVQCVLHGRPESSEPGNLEVQCVQVKRDLSAEIKYDIHVHSFISV